MAYIGGWNALVDLTGADFGKAMKGRLAWMFGLIKKQSTDTDVLVPHLDVWQIRVTLEKKRLWEEEVQEAMYARKQRLFKPDDAAHKEVRIYTHKHAGLKAEREGGERIWKRGIEHNKGVQLDEINANIDALKKKMSEVQNTISGTDGVRGAFDTRRKELRSQFDELITKRNELNDARGKILEQLKSIQSNIRKKTDEVKSSKDKLGYKSVEEIDAQIATLEKQLSTGQVKSLIEEKRIVQEISNLKKSKKILESFSGQQTSVEGEKKTLDELRKKLDEMDPQRTAVRTSIDQVKAQMNALDEERKKGIGNFGELIEQRKSIKAQLDAEYEKLREVRTEFRKAKDEYYTQLREEQARKREEWKQRRQQEEEEKLAVELEKEREFAEIPAFVEEINMCDTLIKFLATYSTDPSKYASTSTAPDANKSTSSALNIRKVDSDLPDGAMMLKKKQDREDEYLVMGGGKGKKGRKGGASASTKTLKFDLVIMEQLLKLKVTVPTSAAEVDKTIVALEEKKKHFVESQAAQTAENKRKAEEKIAALKKKAAERAAALEAGNASDASEEKTEEAATEEEVETTEN
ncbi:hypothetical protein HK102_007009 [Quaeritorhiza haematococci]|nr:hypothetical protein HK102_007009 [Quaeritorhiza haematococci]